MSEKRTGAKFTYSIKAASGYRSKMEGTLRGAEHHAVVSAAANGDLVDDINMLFAAQDMFDALNVCFHIIRLQNGNLHGDTNAIQDMARLALEKAAGKDASS